MDDSTGGYPGPAGKAWNATTLYRMALNPVYIGTWVYGKHGRWATPDIRSGSRSRSRH